MSTIKEKVLAIIAGALGVSTRDVQLEWMFGDVPEWDSLRHVAIITQIEEAFDLVFDVDQITELEGVEDIIDLVAQCKAGASN